MSTQEAIFEKVKRALAMTRERTAYPVYDSADFVSKPHTTGGTVEEIFRKNFAAVKGVIVSDAEELRAVLAGHGVKKGCCDAALTVMLQGLGVEWETSFDRARLDEYDLGATIASGAIAETGSLILRDRATPDRLAALAPWVHVAVLRRADIVLTLPEALARLGDDPYTLFVTGPSKTADVEGILIEGVHGPGVQIAWLVD
ncbi:MAG: LUD domain-containing protein [Verrucomicrobiales bacterium]|jgi:L-lactate dehydrogenase complex protein LldG|nr:LUD domain-containing protein [Verrucomicrobiales bacterium]